MRYFGLFTIICAALTLLKMLHIIKWPWWKVLAPLWFPATIFILVIVFGALMKT